MSSSLYVSLTGLQAYSNGLNSISNNVGNMNTTGYKKNDLLFQDLVYKYKASPYNTSSDNYNQGSGVTADSSFVNFAQGEIKKTDNDTDVAIDGRGFFILKDRSGNYLYTRNGRFEFSEGGDLVLQSTDMKVQSLDSTGRLEDINISSFYRDPASPTTSVSLTGNISTTASSYTLSNDVNIYDFQGTNHQFTITFTKDLNLVRTWNISINDENNNLVDNAGQIRFQGNGSVDVGFESYTFTYTPASLPAQNITLEFGTAGTFDGVTSFSGTSELQVREQDGYASGGLVSTNFDENGVLERIYSNGRTNYGEELALANFQRQQVLKPVGSGLFIARDTKGLLISHANSDGLGRIEGKSIELSNVELTDQFTDMVVIQRGYQASSQVLTATNEMIQQLIEATKSR